MFNSARLKLTLWYLLIIMFISISFSLVIYRFSTSEINRVLRMERLRQQGLYTPGNRIVIPFQFTEPDGISGMVVTPPNTELLEEAKERILFLLIAVNLGIFGLAGALGFFLAGKTLRPIKTMVDEQNRFITDASHELRTPLTSLKSEIEVNLRDTNLSAAQAKKVLESNLEEVNNLQYLSDNLIKLAQNNNSHGSNFESFTISEIAKNAIKKVEKLAGKKNIKIKNDSGSEMIYGDKQSLTEVLVILLDNAIKYSPEKNEVKLRSFKSGKNTIIEVEDNGIGIDKKEIPHLFERFYRADKARTEDGYGLGLSIAKQITEKHHGSITAENKKTVGSIFKVKLPIH